MTQNICRSCLSAKEPANLTPIYETFDSDSGQKTIWEGLCYCAKLQPNTQDIRIPQSICNQCLDELTVAVKFRRKCEESDNILTQRLKDFMAQSVNLENDTEAQKEPKPQDVVEVINQRSAGVSRKKRKVLSSKLINKETDRLHMCEECGKTFARRHDLRRHQFSHTTNRPLNCEICKKSFKSRGAIRQHMFTHSDAEKKECEICQKQFSFASALRHHMEVHTAEKNLQCEFCDKRFGIEYALKQHIAIHKRMTLRNFQCDQCGVSFKHECHLKQHMFTHVDVRPFKCPDCDKSFKTQNDLGKHAIYHGGKRQFVCECCKKAFLLRSALDRHMRTHTKEKPYECRICKKRFPYQSSLKIHYATHCERRHTCDQCNKTFSRMSLYVKHMDKWHDVKSGDLLLYQSGSVDEDREMTNLLVQSDYADKKFDNQNLGLCS